MRANPASPAHDAYDPALIRRVLAETRTIALVGASANPARPSHHVMAFLLGRGYRVIPVNPGLGGQTLLGQPVVARLADLPEPVDMVEIFRQSDAAGGVVDEALALPRPPRFIWMQIGVRDDAAAARAEAAGCVVVMDRCPKIEIDQSLEDRFNSACQKHNCDAILSNPSTRALFK